MECTAFVNAGNGQFEVTCQAQMPAMLVVWDDDNGSAGGIARFSKSPIIIDYLHA